MKIAIASPPIPQSLADGLTNLQILIEDAVKQGAEIICFPESYLPGYPGMPYSKEDREPAALEDALQKSAIIASKNDIAIILPMDWYSGDQLLNVAFVISKEGKILGYQSKNQLDPSEDHIWIAGKERHVFEVDGLKFGISICHEGFRYPETVRWAAQRGAKIVFHPHFTGSDHRGVKLQDWGERMNPYYEKAMMMRALENTIYFASSNYATNYHESASAIIAPDGTCIINEKYGNVGIIVADIDLELATGFLANRLKNELYI